MKTKIALSIILVSLLVGMVFGIGYLSGITQ